MRNNFQTCSGTLVLKNIFLYPTKTQQIIFNTLSVITEMNLTQI